MRVNTGTSTATEMASNGAPTLGRTTQARTSTRRTTTVRIVVSSPIWEAVKSSGMGIGTAIALDMRMASMATADALERSTVIATATTIRTRNERRTATTTYIRSATGLTAMSATIKDMMTAWLRGRTMAARVSSSV